MTLDPGPHVYPPVYAKVPPTLPFEHALPPNEEDWESRYLALDYALSNAPARAPEFFEYDALDDAMRPRGLVSPALLGGEEAWIWVVPSRIIAALGALEKASLASTLDGWNQRSPAQNRPEDLVALSELARNATAARRDMFLWVIPPPHRHLPGATT